MSAIHNDIYQERSFTAINFRIVVRSIFDKLRKTYSATSDSIELHVEADVPYLGLDLTQPCALIVNELLSNSIRHAYPEGKGPVYVHLSIDESEIITLRVKDHGVGLPESIIPEHADTTGFRLVHMLATGQLRGTVEIYRNGGTTIEIKFKRIKDKKNF